MSEDKRVDRVTPSEAAGAEDPDRIARLLRLAGPRPEVPAERAERVRSHLREEWRRSVRARRRRRLVAIAAPLAAAAALAVVLLIPPGATDSTAPVPEGPPVRVARVEAVSGDAFETAAASPAGPRDPRLSVGDVLWSGHAVETSTRGRAALRLEGGSSIRLDRDTRVRLIGEQVFELDRGAVYVDSGVGAAEVRAVEIHTAVGIVRDVGTQFEVRTAGDAVRIRVREGRVDVDGASESWQTTAGGELRVERDGSVTRAEVPVFGPAWSWVLEIAPPFDLEGSTLEEFLSWAERETGWEVRFEDPGVAASAPGVVLHGSVAALSPDQAIDVVLPTCGLAYRLESGSLWVHPEPDRS